jgi:hypothetical protein
MGMYDADQSVDDLREVIRIETPEFDFRTLKRLQRSAYTKFFLTRFRFLKMLPKLISLRSSRRYLRAIERNFLPEALIGKTTRAN